MTIKDLRQIIEGLPDDLEVGGAGHFGEMLKCLDIYIREVIININDNPRIWQSKSILCITLEDAGEEPD